MRENGGGDQKLSKNACRHLWTTPNSNLDTQFMELAGLFLSIACKRKLARVIVKWRKFIRVEVHCFSYLLMLKADLFS